MSSKLDFSATWASVSRRDISENWRGVKARLAQGMRIKMLTDGSRGFIEYLPGEHCFRVVKAKGHMFIHCTWIVGKRNQGQGHGSYLLEQCISDVKRSGMLGIATVTHQRVWIASDGLFARSGFEVVDEALGFHLLVRRFKPDVPVPVFPRNWAKWAAAYPNGLTVFRSDQCPCIIDATETIVRAAHKRNIDVDVVEMKPAPQIRRVSPTPYGVFGVVFQGKPLSYHYVLEKYFDHLLAAV